jgi:hypothetical protein
MAERSEGPKNVGEVGLRHEGNGKAVLEKRGEIYTYEASHPVYGMNWSVRCPYLRNHES